MSKEEKEATEVTSSGRIRLSASRTRREENIVLDSDVDSSGIFEIGDDENDGDSSVFEQDDAKDKRGSGDHRRTPYKLGKRRASTPVFHSPNKDSTCDLNEMLENNLSLVSPPRKKAFVSRKEKKEKTSTQKLSSLIRDAVSSDAGGRPLSRHGTKEEIIRFELDAQVQAFLQLLQTYPKFFKYKSETNELETSAGKKKNSEFRQTFNAARQQLAEKIRADVKRKNDPEVGDDSDSSCNESQGSPSSHSLHVRLQRLLDENTPNIARPTKKDVMAAVLRRTSTTTMYPSPSPSQSSNTSSVSSPRRQSPASRMLHRRPPTPNLSPIMASSCSDVPTSPAVIRKHRTPTSSRSMQLDVASSGSWRSCARSSPYSMPSERGRGLQSSRRAARTSDYGRLDGDIPFISTPRHAPNHRLGATFSPLSIGGSMRRVRFNTNLNSEVDLTAYILDSPSDEEIDVTGTASNDENHNKKDGYQGTPRRRGLRSGCRTRSASPRKKFSEKKKH